MDVWMTSWIIIIQCIYEMCRMSMVFPFASHMFRFSLARSYNKSSRECMISCSKQFSPALHSVKYAESLQMTSTGLWKANELTSQCQSSTNLTHERLWFQKNLEVPVRWVSELKWLWLRLKTRKVDLQFLAPTETENLWAVTLLRPPRGLKLRDARSSVQTVNFQRWHSKCQIHPAGGSEERKKKNQCGMSVFCRVESFIIYLQYFAVLTPL